MPNETHATAPAHHLRRARLLSALGWEPEPCPCPPGERYAATTGELWRWLAEERGGEFADAVRSGSNTVEV